MSNLGINFFNKEGRNKGFSLIEVIAVVMILSILMSVASLSVLRSIENTKKEVCLTNIRQLEKYYEAYLITKDLTHTNVIFEQFMKEYGEEICPENGEIRYVDRKVECSIHSMDENEEGDDGNVEEVPFL